MTEDIKYKIDKGAALMVHAASDFTKTICGISFNNAVSCRMTNVIKEVTCPDCITILEIWNKNKIRSDKMTEETKKIKCFVGLKSIFLGKEDIKNKCTHCGSYIISKELNCDTRVDMTYENLKIFRQMFDDELMSRELKSDILRYESSYPLMCTKCAHDWSNAR